MQPACIDQLAQGAVGAGSIEDEVALEADNLGDQSRKVVFVVKDDDTVEERQVTLGPLNEGLRVIREGLKPEDRVIIDGLQRALAQEPQGRQRLFPRQDANESF